MRSLVNIRQIFAVALFVAAAGLVSAADAAAGADAKAAAAAAKEKARSGSGSNLQSLIEKISSQREQLIADHDLLAKQLKDAKENERKKIMDRMHEQKKAFEEAQSALHKQIRDEQRRQRQDAGPGRR